MSEEKIESTGLVLGRLGFALFALPFSTFVQTWAIMKCWNWHAVVVLGAPALTMWSALGLSCLFTVFGLNMYVGMKDKRPFKELASLIVGKWIGYALIVWLAYWAT